MGYSRAGFRIVGVDIEPQSNYPFEFVQADAVKVLASFAEGRWSLVWSPAENCGRFIGLGQFDAIHASPPCQLYSTTHRIRKNNHQDLVSPTRDLLEKTGLPWVIENVPGSPLIEPAVLEGQMFEGLRTQRKRWFETNWPLEVPFMRSPRPAPQAKMGRKPKDHEWVHVVGNAHSPKINGAAMGIDWMNRSELSEAIPPAYTEYIGTQLLRYIKEGTTQ